MSRIGNPIVVLHRDFQRIGLFNHCFCKRFFQSVTPDIGKQIAQYMFVQILVASVASGLVSSYVIFCQRNG